MTYPGGIEAKVRKFLSKVGIQAEEQTYRIITPVPSDRLWILLRVNNTNELLHPDQLRVQLIQPGGVTNIQEFNLLRPPFTNKELFGFSVRLHGTLEDPSGTWIEIVARSTNILSRKFTNHLGTLEIR